VAFKSPYVKGQAKKKIWAYGKNQVATKRKCEIPGHVILAETNFH